MADSGWDDLFAKAGAKGLETEQPLTVSNAKQKKNKKKKKKKKRKRLETSRVYQEWLEQRLTAHVDNDETMAANYRVGKALDPNCSSSCQGFNSKDSKDNKKDGKNKNKNRVCTSCGQALSLHYLHPAASSFPPSGGFHQEQQQELPLALWLCTIRNLCSCAFAVATQQLDPSVLSSVIGCQQDELRQQWHHHRGTPTLVDRLVGKNNNNHFQNNNKNNKWIVWERCIRLVMACNQEYHDRYYRALTTPPQDDQHAMNELPPHPVTYFGHGFFSPMVHPDDDNDNNDNNNSHALFRLHRLRFNETQQLFSSSGWCREESSRQEMMKALSRQSPKPRQDDDDNDDESSFLAQHETPAPSILSDWNDSCRDILCNLYSYATLHPSTLDAIQQFLVENQIDTLVEIGAGTGYLARLLQDRVQHHCLKKVQALDVAPTSVSSNEYHGRVPPFFPVHQGSTVASSRDDEKTALLLCYPTPQTIMAHQALASYQSNLSQGQRQTTGCFVHIGETKGLTGSSALEQLLLKEWTCTQRIPCQWWGTDASFVTMWIHHHDKKKKPPLLSNPPIRFLLPCSHCGQCESQRRCRAARPMTYCGPACFQQGQTALQQYLDQQCIPLRAARDLNYHNPLHFSSLD